MNRRAAELEERARIERIEKAQREEAPEVTIEPEPLSPEEAFAEMARAISHDPGGYHLQFTRWTKGKDRLKISTHVVSHEELMDELLALKHLLDHFDGVEHDEG